MGYMALEEAGLIIGTEQWIERQTEKDSSTTDQSKELSK